MPELPDLLYIQAYLQSAVHHVTVGTLRVTQPVILRSLVHASPADTLQGKQIHHVSVRGPFIRISLSGGIEVVINLMLAGRLQHQKPGEKAARSLCLSLSLSDGSRLNLCDETKMAKVYLAATDDLDRIPAYRTLGVDVLSPEFSEKCFFALAREHPGKQVRSFINNHSLISAIGNAYADEILFEARLHPKTFVRTCSEDDLRRLYTAIRTILQWGIQEVRNAAQPIHVKVREHVRVRNRRGEPCPRCGTTIRREGVRGYDVFFCPVCQPATRTPFIDWRTTPPNG